MQLVHFSLYHPANELVCKMLTKQYKTTLNCSLNSSCNCQKACLTKYHIYYSIHSSNFSPQAIKLVIFYKADITICYNNPLFSTPNGAFSESLIPL